MASDRIPLLEGYYLHVCKPDGPKYWYVSINHNEFDVDIDFESSRHGFTTRRVALGTAVVECLQFSDYAQFVPVTLYPRINDADVQLVYGQRAVDEIKAKYLR
jgi:hypothetical protein